MFVLGVTSTNRAIFSDLGNLDWSETTATHKHGSHAETKPDRTIFTKWGKNGLHPSRPQTLFKSSENLSVDRLYKI